MPLAPFKVSISEPCHLFFQLCNSRAVTSRRGFISYRRDLRQFSDVFGLGERADQQHGCQEWYKEAHKSSFLSSFKGALPIARLSAEDDVMMAIHIRQQNRLVCF
ncbi:hypothetical protein BN440_0741 [Erwinia amylovora MR1]|nr:hypothetical protein BN440_0741 [Erwinia amylovora MR1]